MKHHHVVILGGGAGGISVAARLKHACIKDIAIIEHADYHAYQPAWPLVGSGAENKKDTRKKMKNVIPKDTTWIKQSVKNIQAVERMITLDNGDIISYDYLLIALGIELNFDAIDGLHGNLGKYGICTNYLYDYVDYTYKTLQNITGGNVIVTKPDTPIKGGVAPENSLFMFDEYFKDHHRKPELILKSGRNSLFPVKKYRDSLIELLEKKHIDYELNQELIAVKAQQQIATFKNKTTNETYDMPFQMLLITPPMRAPKVVRDSSLSDADGWLELNPYTLQHVRHQNIFGIGDCTNLPTIKMGAAVRKQAPIVADNMIAAIKHKPLKARYDGMTACPIATEYGEAIMAEFGYDMKPKETLPINQAENSHFLYFMKKRLVPFMYWHGMLKGRS